MFGWQPDASTIARDWIVCQLVDQKKNAVETTRFTWTIVLPGPGSVIGWVALELEGLTVHGNGKLDVCLSPDHRGHGYGSQVLNEVIRWAFEDLVPTFTFADGHWTGHRLGRVTALVMPHNTASIRMMQKTLLDDHGTVLARRRTNHDDPPCETRHFYLMQPDYIQRHAKHL